MKKQVLKFFSHGRWLRLAASYISQPGKLKGLLQSVSRYAGKEGLSKVSGSIKLLWQYLSDIVHKRYTAYNGRAMLLVVAGLIYLVTPMDFLPDFIVGGLIDDVGIVLYIIKSVEKEMQRYKEHLNHRNIV